MSFLHRRFRAVALALITVGACGAWTAQAITIATFADPAADGSTPLFTLSGMTLTGGWSATGLNLLTPGIPAPDFPDAHFTLTPLTVSPSGVTSGGSILFTDASSAPLFTIMFDSGQLSPIAFGATEFLSLNVVSFSGPIVPPGLNMESFAFSFANQTVTPLGFTATASFTSSAVPEPASIMLLAGGVASLIRRRR